MAIATWLAGHGAPTLGATGIPVIDVIDLLLRRAVADEQLRETVDSNVQWLFYSPVLRPVVMDCIYRLAELKAPVATLFDAIFDQIKENESDFAKLLTTWLLSPLASNQAIRSVLVQCDVGTAPVVLDTTQFMAASQNQQIVACRRLQILGTGGSALCKFIGIFAETPAMQPIGLAYARQMLPAVMEEFPGATEDFLRTRTGPDQKQMPYATLYRAALARALHWRRILKRLPKRDELKPTDDEIHVLRMRQQRRTQEIVRSARERSIFRDISTNLHLAQGKRFASHDYRGSSGVSEMAELSHSIELPSSELSDPARASMNRSRTLGATR
ncbi:hypothetical protein CKY39_08015 [Variovorax boronicumulans]|uniref:Uncharacterized protein n=2 Tax=Variovorax boronicumulans TaxID=436515 RepID=A0A250DG99_9BURK|nr:hypothetical protein CKY39_08015 [Variovorax boronicumulans]